jgi:hypothetical protein
MRCPYCGSEQDHVVDSRPTQEGKSHPATARVPSDADGDSPPSNGTRSDR